MSIRPIESVEPQPVADGNVSTPDALIQVNEDDNRVKGSGGTSLQLGANVARDRFRAMEALESLGPQAGITCVVVEGDPPSKARPRYSRNGHVYTPHKTVEGEKRLSEAFRGVEKFSGNVAVVAIFRRKTHQRIDVDNMLKAILDAGTRADLWDDDYQVTALLGFVEYDPDHPRVTVAFGRHTSSLRRGSDADSTCDSCGERFRPEGRRMNTARWCSRACRMTLAEPVICLSCGRPYKRRTGNQKFCSDECRHLGHRKTAPEKTP